MTFLLAAGCSPADGTDPGSDPAPDPGAPGTPGPAWSGSLSVHLQRLFPGGTVVSFGLPLLPGTRVDPAALRLQVKGRPIAAAVKPILYDHDANGAASGPRSLLVQFAAAEMAGDTLDVDIGFSGDGPAATADTVPYSVVSTPSPVVVETAVRNIAHDGSSFKLVETATQKKVLFTGREPRVLATFPPGYLAATGILGQQRTRAQLVKQPDLAGLRYLSDNVAPFMLSAMYAEDYPLNPDPESVPDPVQNYEGWLYDRCATFLTGYAHLEDPRFLRHALQTCSYYESKIAVGGPNAGTFSGKPDPDPKYSHLRGLFAYYALTGDEGALAAGTAIADLWLQDPLFAGPYRRGSVRGVDKLWTERLLGTSIEGLFYGHRLTGKKEYLDAARQLVDTAYTHITTQDQAVLNKINLSNFPPQNCFVHNASQAAEGDTDQPWCSGWMSELLIDVLLRYQEQTGDRRADEIFVRLARFLRDVGTAYFDSNPHDDRFLKPSVCYDPSKGVDTRRLVPLYGSALRRDGTRYNGGDFSDFEHCTDATALTAAALRALKRQGGYDRGGPIGPFESEGASLLQLHHEFSACAQMDFVTWDRTGRDPHAWTSTELAPGSKSPAQFIKANLIGYPSHPASPQRKLSWWFNQAMLQFGLLSEAQIAVPALTPGKIQPAGCR